MGMLLWLVTCGWYASRHDIYLYIYKSWKNIHIFHMNFLFSVEVFFIFVGKLIDILFYIKKIF